MTLRPAVTNDSSRDGCDGGGDGAEDDGPSAGDSEFASRPMFGVFDHDVVAQRIFEDFDPMSLLREFVGSAITDPDIVDTISKCPEFAAYHAQIVKDEFPVAYRGSNVWIVPATN